MFGMKTNLKHALIFVAGVLVAQVATYFIAGIIAQTVLGVGRFYPPSSEAISYLRDPLSEYVRTYIFPAQILRGIFYGIALLPFRKSILAMGQKMGGLAVAGIVFVIGYFASSGGLIEHFVFFNEYPLTFAFITTIEIAIQALLMGQILLCLERKFNSQK